MLHLELVTLTLCSHEHAYLVWFDSAWNGPKKRQVHTTYYSSVRFGNYKRVL